MKKLLIILAILFAANTYAASPAATQEWVRRYVATNTTTKASTQIIEQSMIIDGTNVTMSVTLNRATEPAWRITESSVSGMPVGVNFALDAYGNACNYTNTVCTTLYQSPSTNFCIVISGVTNNVTAAQLDFTVAGVNYRGYEDVLSGELVAAGLTQKTGIVRFHRSYVTRNVKDALITPPATLSLGGLFISPAYADWVLDSNWTLDETANPNPSVEDRDDGGKIYTYYWVAHYKWDGRNGVIEVPSITASFEGGAKYTFDVDFVSDELISAGSDYCSAVDSFGDRDALEDAWTSEIYDACEEALASNRKILTVFRRFRAANKFDAQLHDCFSTALDAIFASKECPQKNTTTEEQDPEEEEVPDPIPPTEPQSQVVPIYDCGHENIICSSTLAACVFSCAVCKKVMNNGSHHFVNKNGHCAVCDRSYEGKSCGFHSDRRADHIFVRADGSGFGGTEDGCYCANHHVWVPHASLSLDLSKWMSDASGHWREKSCSTCGWHGGVFEFASHYPIKTLIYVDNATHIYTNKCYTCDRVIDGGVEAHKPTSELPSRYIDKKDGTHDYYLICKSSPGGCGAEYKAGNEAHTEGGTLILPPENLGESGHRTNAVCAAAGCGGILNGSTVNHDYTSWSLSKSWLVNDSRVCDCGYKIDANHKIAFSEIVHWCANGDTHLMGVHNWDTSNTNKCATCGFIRGASEDLREARVFYSECNMCSITETRYRDTIESGWSPWCVTGVSCKYGWDFAKNCCGCDACQNGNHENCWCEHGAPMPKWIVKITDNIIERGTPYATMYAGNTDITTIDGDDPVYEIKAHALEFAFTNCVNLTTVKFNYCTNVGDYAFSYAFHGCTNLTTVQFARLENIGEGAFRNNPFKTVEFPAAIRVGNGALSGCSLTSVSLTNAMFIGSFALSGCLNLTSISLPSATMIDGYAFYNDSSLTSISIPKALVRTNVFLGCNSLTTVTCTHSTKEYITSSNYFGAPSGCVFHCSDGDVTVP